jgi:hypothetical protein
MKPQDSMLRNPHFQAKTLMVILALAWIPIGLWETNFQIMLILFLPHVLMAFFAFKERHVVMDVLVYLVGTELAFWILFPILSGGVIVNFVRVLFILLCGRTVYALIRASIWIEKLETLSQHGFEPVMKKAPAVVEGEKEL